MKETSWDKAPSLIYPILPSSAKPQLDGLVLFSVNPATHPTQYVAEAPVYVAEAPPPTPTRESLDPNISQWKLTK